MATGINQIRTLMWSASDRYSCASGNPAAASGKKAVCAHRIAYLAKIGGVAWGVPRQTTYTWNAVLGEGGINALRALPTRGRSARLDEQQLQLFDRILVAIPPTTALPRSCRRSSAWAFSSSASSTSGSARHGCGELSMWWGSRCKSPSTAPLSVTRTPC